MTSCAHLTCRRVFPCPPRNPGCCPRKARVDPSSSTPLLRRFPVPPKIYVPECKIASDIHRVRSVRMPEDCKIITSAIFVVFSGSWRASSPVSVPEFGDVCADRDQGLFRSPRTKGMYRSLENKDAKRLAAFQPTKTEA